jgi:hypothetical protein
MSEDGDVGLPRKRFPSEEAGLPRLPPLQGFLIERFETESGNSTIPDRCQRIVSGGPALGGNRERTSNLDWWRHSKGW